MIAAMRRRLAALFLALSTLPAQAEEPRHLLSLSAEASYRPALIGTDYELDGYGGLGWSFAPRGLDSAGPIVSVEAGRSVIEEGTLSGIAAGWRWRPGRFYATAMAGFERGASGSRPHGSLDLWWDDRGWMAQARVKATKDYVNARVAVGRRLGAAGPFYGIEIATPDGKARRAGMHTTGLRLPFGAEARLSGGRAWGEDERTDGYYGELSLWRRF